MASRSWRIRRRAIRPQLVVDERRSKTAAPWHHAGNSAVGSRSGVEVCRFYTPFGRGARSPRVTRADFETLTFLVVLLASVGEDPHAVVREENDMAISHHRRQVVQAIVTTLVAMTGLRASCGTPPDKASFFRVRSSDAFIVALIAQGASRSATLTRLLEAIEASNGIVYVEPGACSHGVRACLQMWVQVSGPHRFLRVVVDRRKVDSDGELTGLIGHELQHAIEGLGEPSVTDGVKLYNFFRRYAPTDNNRFETTLAINIGNAIRDELRRD